MIVDLPDLLLWELEEKSQSEKAVTTSEFTTNAEKLIGRKRKSYLEFNIGKTYTANPIKY